MDFTHIDIEIEKFLEGKNISVTDNLDGDSLNSDWRQLVWRKDEIFYLIEIYSETRDDKDVNLFIFYTAAFYDDDDKRFYIKKEFAKKVPIDSIAENISLLLNDSYEYISKITKSEIPFAITLKH